MTATTETSTRKRSTEHLRALAQDGAVLLDGASAEEVAAWAARTFPGTLAVACSMADAVLPHLVSQHSPGVDVLFLDTGYHFEQTLATREQVARSLPVRVVDVQPQLTVAQQDVEFGARLHDRDPTSCCRMRKVDPLRGALHGYEAWATGMRREEALTRSGTPLVSYDEVHDLVKLNPLAAWSFDDVSDYARLHRVRMNPLLADGYPSIGCEPCTARVTPGADPRSGRWTGSAKTECGIHS